MGSANALVILGDIIQLLTGGLVQMANGLAGGITAIVKGVFLDINADTGVVNGLSVFGDVVIIFSAIALSLSLFRLLFSWIAGLGGSRRV